MENKIIELWKAGKTNKEIASILGVVPSLIVYYKKRNGYVKPLRKVKSSGKRSNRILLTGFDKDTLHAATLKFHRKRENAKKAGHEFTILFEDVVWNTHCPILGVKLDYFSDKMVDESPSFDRLDNSKGYVKGNVLIISLKANRLKSNGTKEDMLKVIEFLENNGM